MFPDELNSKKNNEPITKKKNSKLHKNSNSRKKSLGRTKLPRQYHRGTVIDDSFTQFAYGKSYRKAGDGNSPIRKRQNYYNPHVVNDYDYDSNAGAVLLMGGNEVLGDKDVVTSFGGQYDYAHQVVQEPHHDTHVPQIFSTTIYEKVCYLWF